MKSIRMCVAVVALALAGCGGGGDIPYGGKDDSGDGKPKPALAVVGVHENSISLPSGAVTEWIDVRTNIADWTATAHGEWLTVEAVRDPAVPLTGAEVTQRLKITASANTDTAPRMTTVTLSGGGIEADIDVTQAAAGAVLTFDTPRNVPAAGETIEVAVTANVEYSYVVPAEYDWVNDATPEGAAKGVYTFRIAPHDGVEGRTATVEFTGDGVGGKALAIVQQGGEPAVSVDGSRDVAVAWDAETVTLTVTANTGYEVGVVPHDAVWIVRKRATRGMAAHEETFTLLANEGGDARTATITFYIPDVSPRIGADITVTQAGKPPVPQERFEIETPTDGTLRPSPTGSTEEISIVTGREPSDIVAATPAWMQSQGEPRRDGDVLVYKFTAKPNIHRKAAWGRSPSRPAERR